MTTYYKEYIEENKFVYIEVFDNGEERVLPNVPVKEIPDLEAWLDKGNTTGMRIHPSKVGILSVQNGTIVKDIDAELEKLENEFIASLEYPVGAFFE